VRLRYTRPRGCVASFGGGQLVINTGTTIVTFLMVFLTQRTQNKDGLAIQQKLNELVAAVQGASNRLIDVEDLSEERSSRSRAELDVAASHSIEEAEGRHVAKRAAHQPGKTRP
jgi:low affinity Fe/Cu permease